MTNEEIKENNVLIAEFMGLKVDKVWESTLTPYFIDGRYTNLRYNQSWDWLMEVVEKIWNIIGNRSSLWYFEVSENETIYSNREYDGNNLLDCYSAVVNFIIWYNDSRK